MIYLCSLLIWKKETAALLMSDTDISSCDRPFPATRAAGNVDCSIFQV
jgi:hypothetical protein